MSTFSKKGFVKEKLKMNKIIKMLFLINIYIFFNFSNQKKSLNTNDGIKYLLYLYVM